MDEKQAFNHAQERFKDHVATYCDYGPIKTLTWAKPGRRDYSVRYVFDTEAHTMTITGDIGHAVVCPTCKVDLENCAKSFRWVDYFAEKIKASSDMYMYDEQLAKAQLREYLLPEGTDPEDVPEREELIDRIMEDYDVDQPGVRILDAETANDLNRIDPDAFEWIGTIGRRYHLRVYLWMYGLQLSWKQLRGKELPEFHPVLGMSTAHLPKEVRDDLDRWSNEIGEPSPVVAYQKKFGHESYGWWVTCNEEPEENVPAPLRDCMNYARKLGATWIMFDGDSTVYDGLPTY